LLLDCCDRQGIDIIEAQTWLDVTDMARSASKPSLGIYRRRNAVFDQCLAFYDARKGAEKALRK